MGFDYRATSSFVTDPSYGVPVLLEAFPHTYTNGGGFSVNAGITQGFSATVDRSATNDPRIAGVNYQSPSAITAIFKVDLNSGSAPGAGNYSIDLAAGDTPAGRHYSFVQVLDGSTTLINFNGTTAGGGHYFDATGTDITASSSWTGTPVTKSFATTNAFFQMSSTDDFACIAHFRMTLQAAGSNVAQHMLTLLGVGA